MACKLQPSQWWQQWPGVHRRQAERRWGFLQGRRARRLAVQCLCPLSSFAQNSTVLLTEQGPGPKTQDPGDAPPVGGSGAQRVIQEHGVLQSKEQSI